MAQNSTSRYRILRSYPKHVVERQWAKYRTVLQWPEREPQTEPAPVAPPEPYLHTKGWVGKTRGNANTRLRFCEPPNLCPLHQTELARLIETTPPDAKHPHEDVENITLRDDYESIRTEAARHGCAVLSTDRPLPEGDIPESEYAGRPAPYVRPDHRTISLIALERAMYYAGGPRGARVMPDGTIRLIGYQGQDRIAAQRRFVERWTTTHGWQPTPANISAYRKTVAHIKFTAMPVKRSYFWHYLDARTDADPTNDRRVEREVQERWLRNHDRNEDCHRPPLALASIPLGSDLPPDNSEWVAEEEYDIEPPEPIQRRPVPETLHGSLIAHLIACA